MNVKPEEFKFIYKLLVKECTTIELIIFYSIYYNNLTYKEIGLILNLSQERIRQILNKVYKRIQKIITTNKND